MYMWRDCLGGYQGLSPVYAERLYDSFVTMQRLIEENKDYLSRQLITYLGNKRSLSKDLINCIERVYDSLGRPLVSADLFSGSGFVSRLLMKYSSNIYSNDLESYSLDINYCFLREPPECITGIVDSLNNRYLSGDRHEGLFQEYYAPKNDQKIEQGERCFYTRDNAQRLDFFTQEINKIEKHLQPFLLGPLISGASVHTNTSGVFKGFYKDKGTNIGKFGGKASNALNRITSPIYLETPVKSNFSPDTYMIQDDAEAAAKTLPEMDLVYLDPPYNQHPYGSNYFMLNRISDYYKEKNNLSVVSGIPDDWNRSTYNKKSEAEQSFIKLLNSLKTKFMLVSYNSEGFITIENMKSILSSYGSVEVYPIQYNTFRGSRNLKNRPLHVTEYLFLVKCYG